MPADLAQPIPPTSEVSRRPAEQWPLKEGAQIVLWLAFAVVTAAVILALARPLLASAPRPEAGGAEADLAVYRDQIREIDSELERGLLSAEEAEAARTELARRLLRRADEAQKAPSEHAGVERGRDLGKAVMLGAAALMPVASIGIYVIVGSPQLPGLPHAERLNAPAAGRSIGDLVGLVEARLRENPEDGKGWEVLAPVYLRQQKFAEAVHAYGNAIRLLGETEARLMGFAEAAVMANDGVVVPAARTAYEKLAKLDPRRAEPRFWLALAKEQDGDVAAALADFKSLLAEAPADAPWRDVVTSRVEELTARLTGKTPPAVSQPSASPPAGPDADAVAAAARMTQQERQAMIEGMVKSLAERLAANGKDLDGWKRLARALKVMGRDGEAREALAKARTSFLGDEAALKSLDELAVALGLKS
ncbi:MAG: c-type cytochrome biogenesis protein CcmI [Hyphomicrobiaceae bacterium]